MNRNRIKKINQFFKIDDTLNSLEKLNLYFEADLKMEEKYHLKITYLNSTKTN